MCFTFEIYNCSRKSRIYCIETPNSVFDGSARGDCFFLLPRRFAFLGTGLRYKRAQYSVTITTREAVRQRGIRNCCRGNALLRGKGDRRVCSEEQGRVSGGLRSYWNDKRRFSGRTIHANHLSD